MCAENHKGPSPAADSVIHGTAQRYFRACACRQLVIVALAGRFSTKTHIHYPWLLQWTDSENYLSGLCHEFAHVLLKCPCETPRDAMQTCRKPDAALRVSNRQKCPLAFGDFKVAGLRCQVLTRHPTGPGASHRLLVSSAPQKANELPTWLFRNRFLGLYNSTPLMHPSKTVLIPIGRLTRRTLHFKQRIENAKTYVRRVSSIL